MKQSSIHIDVVLDENQVPSEISWNATDTSANAIKKASAMMLAFWDAADKTSLRIDLWTKEMMVDEMADFFYQTLMTMADSFQRATRNTELTTDIKQFAKEFYSKFKAQELKENKA